ncbi:MAG: sodium:proton antiporter, partial [Mesorhizobium sp.]
VVPLAVAFGMPSATDAVLHALLTEYMSFIILLFALFTISGGILVAGNIHGTPLVNAGLLLIGAMLASVIGTTGASMILIRPILRANGDPPLFVGFLRGVDFFWTTTNLYQETLFVGGLVLAVFLAMDIILHRREAGAPKIKDPTPDTKVRIRGLPNVPLLAGVIGAILLSATWKPGVAFSVQGVSLE